MFGMKNKYTPAVTKLRAQIHPLMLDVDDISTMYIWNKEELFIRVLPKYKGLVYSYFFRAKIPSSLFVYNFNIDCIHVDSGLLVQKRILCEVCN